MIEPETYRSYYLKHRVPNPVNVTLTQRQCVDGEWLDDLRSELNFRHFANKLNSKVLGARFKRFGKRLAMLVVRESDATHRHHLHCIIERPEHLSEPLFFCTSRAAGPQQGLATTRSILNNQQQLSVSLAGLIIA